MGVGTSDDVSRYLAGSGISALGLLLLVAPLYDIYDDVTNLSWAIGWTLLENSVILLLAGGLVVAGGWLVRSDWETTYVVTVAEWTIVISGIVAALFGWVVAIQLSIMEHAKPYVLALNGILFGSVTALGVGLYSARQRMSTDELEARERHLRQVYTVIGDSSRSFEEQVEAILDHTRDLFDAEDAVFGRVDDADDDVLELAVVASDRANLTSGDRVPVEETHLPTLLDGDSRSQPTAGDADSGGGTFDLGTLLGELEIDLGTDGDGGGSDGGGSRDGVGSDGGGSDGGGSDGSDSHDSPGSRDSIESDAGGVAGAATHDVDVYQGRHVDTDPKTYGSGEPLGLRIGTPLYVNDRVHGAIVLVGTSANEPADGWRAAMVALLSDWLTYELHRQHLVGKLEDRLAEREEQFASVVDAVDEYAIFTLDADGVVTTWNHGAEGILGYDDDEAIGDHVGRFFGEDRLGAVNGAESGGDDVDDVDDVDDNFDDEFGESATIRGERITPLPSDELLERAATKEQVTEVGWCLRADGSRFPASVTVAARYDAGDLVGFTTITRELTKQYRFERTIEQERARLEFVNRFIRHNILNGLNIVNARAEHLETSLSDATAIEHVDVIRDRVDDMAELIDTMRTMMDVIVSEADHDPVPLPLRTVLEREIELARDGYPDARFDVHDLPDESATVVADEILGELFENVLSNAVVHNDKSTPEIEVWTTETTRELPVDPETDTVPLDESGPVVASDPTASPASETETATAPTVDYPAITVHVADNGPGIPVDERTSVLERGVSNLEDPRTGFGLYLVKEMMRAYGGTVAIRDNEPEGTVLDLTLLRADVPEADRLDDLDDGGPTQLQPNQ
ncbi:PAS domain S-box protein [Haloparvum sp. PAK95]|uniref:PAS domain S-box protein n=1 Tax=Haloparvum sp. PAK95 TaxID=3418962 RepID=UPI003D2EF425